MLSRIFITIGCLLLPFAGMADVLKLREDAPKTYVVKKGDTLWDISARFLNQPWLWPKLWRLNPEIKNPHLIYPGDKLAIVYDANGQPMLVKGGKPQIKWSPSIRTQVKKENATAVMPLAKLAPYLTYEQIITSQSANNSPYVLGSDENYKSSIDGFKLYVKGNLTLGGSYAIYDKGEALIDPETDEVLAYEANLLGTGTAIRTGNISERVPATLAVNSIKQEIRAGALVVPITEENLMPAYYTMQPAPADTRGRIIKATNNVREFGKFDIVLLNRGDEQNLNIGDILTIARKSPTVVETDNGPKYKEDASQLNRLTDDIESAGGFKMPEETIGHMMVFKTYEKVSMAVIMSSSKSVKKRDLFVAPQ